VERFDGALPDDDLLDVLALELFPEAVLDRGGLLAVGRLPDLVDVLEDAEPG
jgi:hypothetical protein